MIAIKTPMNLPDENGTVPLSSLVRVSEESGMRPLVGIFLAAGADPHQPHSSRSHATPLEEALKHSLHTVEIVCTMLQHSPLRDNKHTAMGNHLHTAVKYDISKKMFNVLIAAGAEVTALDDNGNTPLAAHLKRLGEGPESLSVLAGLEDLHCMPIWWLWSKKIDIERRNKSGKSIVSYLTALRLYSGECKVRARLVEILQSCIDIVPLPGSEGRKTLRFSSWFAEKDRVLG